MEDKNCCWNVRAFSCPGSNSGQPVLAGGCTSPGCWAIANGWGHFFNIWCKFEGSDVSLWRRSFSRSYRKVLRIYWLKIYSTPTGYYFGIILLCGPHLCVVLYLNSCVLLWDRHSSCFLIRESLHQQTHAFSILAASSNRDACPAKVLRFSSSPCNCQCETPETKLQRSQVRNNVQNFFFCCNIMKLG